MPNPMMTCGHAAQGTVESSGDPVCVICSCTDLAPEGPNLEGRKARCSYFGQRINLPGTYHGCECGSCAERYRKEGKTTCACEVVSKQDLPFFAYCGPGSNHYGVKDKVKGQQYDQFYCGCASWE